MSAVECITTTWEEILEAIHHGVVKSTHYIECIVCVVEVTEVYVCQLKVIDGCKEVSLVILD